MKALVLTAYNRFEYKEVSMPEFGEDEELFLYPATRTIGVEYNLTKAPLDNPDVRLALSQATDRDTMMDVVFSGATTSTTNWVPPARNGLEGAEDDRRLVQDADPGSVVHVLILASQCLRRTPLTPVPVRISGDSDGAGASVRASES